MALPQDPTAAPAAGDPTASGAAGAPGASGAGDPGQDTVTITPDGNGGWSVDCDDGSPPIACKSIGDVVKAVHDCLSGDAGGASDAQSAWSDEASKRDDAPPAAGGAPSMTMP